MEEIAPKVMAIIVMILALTGAYTIIKAMQSRYKRYKDEKTYKCFMDDYIANIEGKEITFKIEKSTLSKYCNHTPNIETGLGGAYRKNTKKNQQYQEHELICLSCGHDINETLSKEDGDKVSMHGSNIICPKCGVANKAYIDYIWGEDGEEYSTIVVERI